MLGPGASVTCPGSSMVICCGILQRDSYKWAPINDMEPCRSHGLPLLSPNPMCQKPPLAILCYDQAWLHGAVRTLTSLILEKKQCLQHGNVLGPKIAMILECESSPFSSRTSS